ncbi:MAG TPA: LysE/ArgO family amino acid transporter, partial [Azospirillaceae bacterium]|nr:LysE/ArgO family amino acid transporter [Azospirillaceae bacterium]
GASLIIAIGAQNAFVLRHGLVRRHVPAIVLFCVISDATLIAVGAAGFGSVVAATPWLLQAIGFGGAAFLLWYGLRAFASAFHPGALDGRGEAAQESFGRVMAIIAALTLLNPHVYLDTVMLLGGIAGRYPAEERIGFAGGAMAASAVWFVALGFGARLLAPVFSRPAAWRMLDVVIGVVMTALALMLLRDAWAGLGNVSSLS